MNTLPAIIHQTPSIAPQELEAAIRYANVIATAKTIPQMFRNSPGDCLLVVEQARDWGMSPAALLRHCSIINNNLMVSGVAIAAAVNANAGIVGRLACRYEGEGDSRKIIVSGRYPDEAEPREIEVTVRSARTKADAWKAQPDQQLFYTGARVWGRRHAPHVMMGVRCEDEVGVDEPTQVPTIASPPLVSQIMPVRDNVDAPQAPATAEAAAAAAIDPTIDPATGEIGPRTLEIVDDNYRLFGQQLIACVRAEKQDDEVQRWIDLNHNNLEIMHRSAEKMWKTLMHSINMHRAGLIGDDGVPSAENTILGAG